MKKFVVALLFFCCQDVSICVSKLELQALYQSYNCCHANCDVPIVEFLRLSQDDTTGHQCKDDMEWTECGSYCPQTCDSNPAPCIEVCVPKCACPVGLVQFTANSTRCVLPEACGCESNSECPNDQWCRMAQSQHFSDRVCVPYANVNQHCAGYVMEAYEERCHPDLSCQDRNDPRIVDAPGICTNLTNSCTVSFHNISFGDNGDGDTTYPTRHYNVGESFKGFGVDHCNTCICLENAQIACTKMTCPRNN